MSQAVELRVVRENEMVKLKLRTPDYLYTYRTSEDEAEDIIKGAKELEVIEITPPKEKASEKKPEEKKKSK
jgi:hypothetical protein